MKNAVCTPALSARHQILAIVPKAGVHSDVTIGDDGNNVVATSKAHIVPPRLAKEVIRHRFNKRIGSIVLGVETTHDSTK
jgi:hypothetical protein